MTIKNEAGQSASAAGAGSEQPLAEAIHAAAVKAGIIAPGTAVSGPQLVMLCDALAQLAAAPAAPHAQAAPAARVDRIISASGLAEVSVFLESALKVGTVFYAALAKQSAAPAAPHAQAEPVDQGQVLRTLRTLLDGSQPKDVPGALIVIDHALKNGIAWSYDMSPPAGFMAYVKANYAGDIYFHDPEWHAVRLWNAAMKNIGPRLAAPVPQEAEQAATPDGSVINEGAIPQPAATAAVTAPAGVTLKAIRAHGSKEWFIYIEHPFGTSYVRMSDRRDLQLAELIACQPAAPAVTDAARDGVNSGCRMTGGICACRSGGSFGGCAREHNDCCTNEPGRLTDAARDVLADAKGGA